VVAALLIVTQGIILTGAELLLHKNSNSVF
jgi:hypothetical protein